MEKNPTVSVIIPFYNSEEFIDEAIQSVLNQTYDDWELLLVDDGSVDGSTNIALRYCNENPTKIYYYEHQNHKNAGPAVTRNLGIKNSRGKYIALLDSDDLWVPDKLTQQVRILDSHPEIGMVCGITIWWYSWNQFNEKKDEYKYNYIGKANSVFYPPNFFKLSVIDGHFISMSNILIKHEVIEKVGLFEESLHDMFEDSVFLSKILLAYPVYVSSSCWDYYRQHKDSYQSIRSRNVLENNYRMIKYLNWILKYMKYKEFEYPEVKIGIRYRRKKMKKEIFKLKYPNISKIHKFVNRWVRDIKHIIQRLVTRGSTY